MVSHHGDRFGDTVPHERHVWLTLAGLLMVAVPGALVLQCDCCISLIPASCQAGGAVVATIQQQAGRTVGPAEMRILRLA